ncbi:MAG: hypothetical protein LUF92_06235, partial [Clostridiales bacterium]|nr:hypothetical protein [Clostridiales bacterium]
MKKEKDFVHAKRKASKLTTSYVLFEAAYFCLAFALFVSLTTIAAIVDERFYTLSMKVIRYLGYILVTVKIVRDGYTLREILWMIVAAALFAVAGITAGDNNLVCMFLFVIGVHNLDFDRILSFCQKFMLAGITVTIFLSLTGVIPNWLYVFTGRNRYSLGFYYPTHLSSCFFYFSILTLYLLKDKFKIQYFILLEFLNYVIYKFTDSRAAFALLFMGYLAFFC